jgi:Holliday junction resolvasome RuvABC endonuclease subunit
MLSHSPPSSAILAFDAGPRKTGWALVSMARSPSVLSVGEVASRAEDLAALVADTSPAHVGIEVIKGYAFAQARTAMLMATSEVAGIIQGLAFAAKCGMTFFSAREWRSVIVGAPAPSDAAVAAALSSLVELPKRSNAHHRDAVGVALATRLALGLPAERLSRPVKDGLTLQTVIRTVE